MIEFAPLLPIQDLDLKIDDLEAKVAHLQEKVDRLAGDIKKEGDLVLKQEALYKKISLRKNQNELEDAQLGEKVKTTEMRLQNPGIPPASYQAMEREIKSNKDLVSELETKILEDMEKSESLKEELEKGKKVLIGRKKQLEEFTVKIAAQKAELNREKELITTQRRQASLGIPLILLELYEDLRLKKKGKVVWETTEDNCPSCGMWFPGSFHRVLCSNLAKAEKCASCGMLIRWTGIVDVA